ncbi:MAG: PQQ-dependent sugar dehydrogenase [Gammaproteobacteria bacterium]
MRVFRIFTAAVALIACAAVADDERPPISVPDGFAATVFHPGLGAVRHMAVRDNGDVYAARRFKVEQRMIGQTAAWGSLLALRDEDGDGAADIVETFGPSDVTTAARIHDGHLYFSSDQVVWRMPLDDKLVPQTVAEPLVGGFPMTGSHGTKTFAFDGAGHMYVNSGAPSNACETKRMTPRAPGIDPCPQLERSAGIWRFRHDKALQDQVRDGQRYVTGTRNVVAIAWNPWADKLFFVMNGRDSIGRLNRDYFTMEDNAELPAEEFHVAEEGDNFGWPYTYYDPIRNERMKDPGYGGDGKTPATGDYKDPLVAFPAHWAPIDLLFHSGNNVPEKYAQGAFISFHGSWDRMPLEQSGYVVAFVPMRDGEITGDWEVFADGFAGDGPVKNPGQAAYRPTGLAEGPDGAIYISEDKHGRIWKVVAGAGPLTN